MQFFSLRFTNIIRGARNIIPAETGGIDASNHRIETLVDGVFAIALTLLVLDIKIPQQIDSDAELTRQLIALVPKFFSYFLSFAILGLLWFEHQMISHFVIRTDRTHIWLSLLFLVCISLIPFSAGLLGAHLSYRSATVFYGMNLFVTGVIQYLHWEYITRKNRLIDENLDRRVVRALQKTFLFVPMSYAIAIEVSLFNIPMGLGLYGIGTFAGALRMNAIFHQSLQSKPTDDEEVIS
jgi:uncharacterized membrane protein